MQLHNNNIEHKKELGETNQQDSMAQEERGQLTELPSSMDTTVTQDQADPIPSHPASRSSKTDIQPSHFSSSLAPVTHSVSQINPTVPYDQSDSPQTSNVGPSRALPGRFSNRTDPIASRQALAIRQQAQAQAQLVAQQQARLRQQAPGHHGMTRPQSVMTQHLATQRFSNIESVSDRSEMPIAVAMTNSPMPLKGSMSSEPVSYKRSFRGSCGVCKRPDGTLHLILCRPNSSRPDKDPRSATQPNALATPPGSRSIPSLPLAMSGPPEMKSVLTESDVLLCATCAVTSAQNKGPGKPAFYVPLAGLDEVTHDKTVRQTYDDALDAIFEQRFYPAEGALVFLAIVLDGLIFQVSSLGPGHQEQTAKNQITKSSSTKTRAEALHWLAVELIDKLTINPCLSPDFVPYAHIQPMGIMSRPVAYALKQQLADFGIALQERRRAEPDWGVVQKASSRSSGLLRYPLPGFRILLRAIRVMWDDRGAPGRPGDEGYAALLHALMWQRLLYLFVENFVMAWSSDSIRTKDDSDDDIFSMPGSDLTWKTPGIHEQTQDIGSVDDEQALCHKGRKLELFVPFSKLKTSSLMTEDDLASLQDIEEWQILQRLATANTSYGYALGLFLHCLYMLETTESHKMQKNALVDSVGAWPVFHRVIGNPMLAGILGRPGNLRQSEAEECWVRLHSEGV